MCCLIYYLLYLFAFKCCKYNVLALVVFGKRIKKNCVCKYILEHYQFYNICIASLTDWPPGYILKFVTLELGFKNYSHPALQNGVLRGFLAFR